MASPLFRGYNTAFTRSAFIVQSESSLQDPDYRSGTGSKAMNRVFLPLLMLVVVLVASAWLACREPPAPVSTDSPEPEKVAKAEVDPPPPPQKSPPVERSEHSPKSSTNEDAPRPDPDETETKADAPIADSPTSPVQESVPPAKGAAAPADPKAAAQKAGRLLEAAKEHADSGESARAFQAAVAAWKSASACPSDRACQKLAKDATVAMKQYGEAANLQFKASTGSDKPLVTK